MLNISMLIQFAQLNQINPKQIRGKSIFNVGSGYYDGSFKMILLAVRCQGFHSALQKNI